MSADQRFFDFLKARIGLDVASVGPALIQRAVRQRAAAQPGQSLEEYWQRLQGSGHEQQALIEAVIVPETWFFRYPESFSTLARLALKRLAEIRGMRALRILSLPCSSGEEPYSIAMALLDAGLAPHQFRVEGLDVSPLSISRGQRGWYGKNSFRGQQTGFRERHFSVEGDGYRLSERVREQVQLQVGNLLDPQLLDHEPPYDFVFCRNLLIYFAQPTQKQALEVLKRLTQVEGVLFIGPAEGSLLARVGMGSIGIPQSFAFSRQRAPEPLPVAMPAGLPPPRASARLASAAPPGRSFSASMPALKVVTPSPAAPDAEALLASIAALANAGDSAGAQAACEQYLRSHGPQAQVFYWQGLLNEVAGHAREAQALYRKALYLQPQHPEALMQLAALLAFRGDTVGARRLQDRAARRANSEGQG